MSSEKLGVIVRWRGAARGDDGRFQDSPFGAREVDTAPIGPFGPAW